jgi:uncharacterized repeat protein (TIGR03803 family)
MESRLLLSAYTANELGQLGVNAGGANPRSTLIADSGGNLYGTASAGGAYGDGTVFEIAGGWKAGSTMGTITTLATFSGGNGAAPYASLTLDPAGNLFGTTEQGGANNDGTVFEIAKGSNAVTTLVSFNGTNGQHPYAGLTLDSSGNLYGTTFQGGATGAGTVFRIGTGSTTLTTITSLDPQQGLFLPGGVALDASGDLFGATSNGGASGYGIVFEIAAGTNTVMTLASFNSASGESPGSGVTLDTSGNLYGTTAKGGANGDGTVFELAKGSSSIILLASLGSNAGAASGVTRDPAGNLFGTTMLSAYGSDGTVFEVASGTGTLTTLASTDQTTGPFGPLAGVMLDSSGDLVGTTYRGGTGKTGTVFEIPKGASSAMPVAYFDGTNAAEPDGRLVLDASGNLYGTTLVGGPSGDGTVFEVPSGSTKLLTVADFNGTNGEVPFGGLTIDGAGNLYGTTQLGGAYGYGTVFEVAAGSSTITTVTSFKYAEGAHPQAGVTLDAAGDLFGTTPGGGASGLGTLFEVAKGSNSVTVIASFTAGWADWGRVTLDTSGNIYGTTGGGGTSNDGTVYEIARGSTAVTTLTSFNGTSGQSPEGELILDPSGNLYGLTFSGGAKNEGVVFELPRGSNALTTVATLTSNVGDYPPALYMDASGNLYDTSNGGGGYSRGDVFEISRGSGTITTLFSFNGTDGGAFPTSGVTADGRGNFYVTTSQGGPGNAGIIYKFSANSAITLAANGPNPIGADQPLSFTATVSGGVPDGQSVQLLDSSNANAVVASGTLSGGSATLNVPANTFSAGKHILIAVYGGDPDFAADQSAPYSQTVQVAVMGVVVNGDNSALTGAQRSMVDSIVYTFSEPVNVGDNAFSSAIHTGQVGTVPSLAWAALNPNSDGSSTQWAVTFNGASVVGNSIANGGYDITLNSASVTSDANSAATIETRPVDTFYRLFGDINGDGRVNNADYAAFLNTNGLKSGQTGFNAAFDSNGDGRVNNLDYGAFLNNNGIKYSGFTATI